MYGSMVFCRVSCLCAHGSVGICAGSEKQNERMMAADLGAKEVLWTDGQQSGHEDYGKR